VHKTIEPKRFFINFIDIIVIKVHISVMKRIRLITYTRFSLFPKSEM